MRLIGASLTAASTLAVVMSASSRLARFSAWYPRSKVA